MRLLKSLLEAVLSQTIVAALVFAGLIGPFFILRFDLALYLSGAVFLAIALIYWPRKSTRALSNGMIASARISSGNPPIFNGVQP